jgi:hypothetical protein
LEQHQRRFVVIAIPRSGSTHLCGLLDSHPEIKCHYEVLHPAEVATSFYFDHYLKDKTRRDLDQKRFIDELFSESFRLFPSAKAVGFKILLSKPQMGCGFEYILDRRDVQKLILNRENRLAYYASVKLALATDIWQSQRERRILSVAIVFAPDEFLKWTQDLDRFLWDVSTRTEGHPVMKLEYSELLAPIRHKEILSFLGADSTKPLHSDWTKIQKPKLIECFTNPNVVVEVLREIGKLEWID